MRRRSGLAIVAGVTAAVVAGGGGRLYTRRTRERVASHEGLDDPEVARAFGRIAEMPQMRLLRRLVVRGAIRLATQGDAVDLGCGGGQLVLSLATVAPEMRITGVDLAAEMLTQAEEHARRAGAGDRVSFRLGDAQHIPFGDASLDLVVSSLSLHHWSEPGAVLDEICRVLRPGGSFLIWDLRRDLAAPFWLLLWFVTHVVVPKALRRVNEPMGSRDAAYTPREVARLAERSRLSGWRVTQGPLWLTLEGTLSA